MKFINSENAFAAMSAIESNTLAANIYNGYYFAETRDAYAACCAAQLVMELCKDVLPEDTTILDVARAIDMKVEMDSFKEECREREARSYLEELEELDEILLGLTERLTEQE